MSKPKANRQTRSEDELRRGNVIVAKGGRAMVLTSGEALDVLDALVEWASDEQRRPKRIEV